MAAGATTTIYFSYGLSGGQCDKDVSVQKWQFGNHAAKFWERGLLWLLCGALCLLESWRIRCSSPIMSKPLGQLSPSTVQCQVQLQLGVWYGQERNRLNVNLAKYKTVPWSMHVLQSTVQCCKAPGTSSTKQCCKAQMCCKAQNSAARHECAAKHACAAKHKTVLQGTNVLQSTKQCCKAQGCFTANCNFSRFITLPRLLWLK